MAEEGVASLCDAKKLRALSAVKSQDRSVTKTRRRLGVHVLLCIGVWPTVRMLVYPIKAISAQ
jgi:hypothetical protein